MDFQINYLSVLCAAVASFLVGWVWYSPLLFAKPWMKLLNLKENDLKKEGMMLKMGLTFVASLVMAYVLAHFLQVAGASTVAEALTVGFWAWLGFTLATAAPNYIFTNKPAKLLAIDSGHHLAGILVASVVLVLWA